jgi:hypothetical protein
MSDLIAPGAGPITPPPAGLRLVTTVGGPPLGVIFAAIGVLGCVAVGLLGLDQLGFPVCFFKLATGLPCPTCGSTRAFGRLFGRDLAGALAVNPLATLLALAVVPWAIADLLLLTRGRSLGLRASPAAARVLRIAVLALVLANWIYLIAAGV